MAVLALLVIVSAVVAAAGWGAASAEPRGAGAPAESSSAVVVVAEGDTLWDVVAPHVPPGTDRGVYAAAVAEANDVDPLRLRPGTALRLP